MTGDSKMTLTVDSNNGKPGFKTTVIVHGYQRRELE